MNPSFIKMLRFEYKSNLTFWIYNLTITLSAIALLLYTMRDGSRYSFLQTGLLYFIFCLTTWVFTLHSYQESTSTQSMQMYHLIGVSREVKFFSKQLITLLAYPLLIMAGTAMIIFVINLFISDNIKLEILPSQGKVLMFLLIWILGHSTATLLAIVFKKNKILYALLTYFIARIVLGIVVLLLIFVFNSFGLNNTSHLSPSFHWERVGMTVTFILAAIFYGISYHLFFKRQL